MVVYFYLIRGNSKSENNNLLGLIYKVVGEAFFEHHYERATKSRNRTFSSKENKYG